MLKIFYTSIVICFFSVNSLQKEGSNKKEPEEHKIKNDIIYISRSQSPDLPYKMYSILAGEKHLAEHRNKIKASYYSDKGKQWVLYDYKSSRYMLYLEKHMELDNGAILEIEGKLIKKRNNINTFEITKQKIAVKNTDEIKKKVLEKYLEIREEINKLLEKSSKTSKLKLPSKKNFLVSWDMEANKLIFSSSSSDLMWVIDLFFVVDSDSEKIEKIYCQKWFKGE